jgi:hypothetical protein
MTQEEVTNVDITKIHLQQDRYEEEKNESGTHS